MTWDGTKGGSFGEQEEDETRGGGSFFFGVSFFGIKE